MRGARSHGGQRRIIHSYGSNARIGQGEWMVVEADESDGTFNRLPATVAIRH
jgi:UDP-N-acetylmuramate--alanine ligase